MAAADVRWRLVCTFTLSFKVLAYVALSSPPRRNPSSGLCFHRDLIYMQIYSHVRCEIRDPAVSGTTGRLLYDSLLRFYV